MQGWKMHNRSWKMQKNILSTIVLYYLVLQCINYFVTATASIRIRLVLCIIEVSVAFGSIMLLQYPLLGKILNQLIWNHELRSVLNCDFDFKSNFGYFRSGEIGSVTVQLRNCWCWKQTGDVSDDWVAIKRASWRQTCNWNLDNNFVGWEYGPLIAYLCWHYLLVLYLVCWAFRTFDRKL